MIEQRRNYVIYDTDEHVFKMPGWENIYRETLLVCSLVTAYIMKPLRVFFDFQLVKWHNLQISNSWNTDTVAVTTLMGFLVKILF